MANRADKKIMWAALYNMKADEKYQLGRFEIPKTVYLTDTINQYDMVHKHDIFYTTEAKLLGVYNINKIGEGNYIVSESEAPTEEDDVFCFKTVLDMIISLNGTMKYNMAHIISKYIIPTGFQIGDTIKTDKPLIILYRTKTAALEVELGNERKQ